VSARRTVLAFAVLASTLLPLFALPARAGDGASYAAVAIAADAQAQAIAVHVAKIAREAIESDPDFRYLSLEEILEGAEPAWIAKRKAAEAARDKARIATEALELPVASDAYAEAIVAYEQAVAGMTDLSPIVDVLAKSGVVLVSQGDKAGGLVAFDRALALDAAFRLPKDGTNKNVQKVFDDALKARKTAGQGTLTAYATVGAAEVWVDGVFRGIAPMSLDVPTGRHYVRMVRDGHIAFGTGVDVKRGSEASVQASLKPTANLAKLEENAIKVPRNKESSKPVAELAAFLQVDRLMAIVVEDTGGSALLTMTVVDGVSGKQLARASKAFAVKDNFFEHDVKVFLTERSKGGSVDEGVVKPADTTANSDTQDSMLPGDAEEVGTPGAVIGGWVMLGLSVLPIASTITFGIISFQLYDGYRNRLPSQLDPNLDPIRQTWLTTSIVTDVSGVLSVALIGGGIAALIAGYNEQAAREEVLAP
jgi:PEGA domain